MVTEPVGISEVAAKAGVSVTTVSHALSGRRPVSAATRTKVMQAVEDLDYRPNLLARSLRTRLTLTTALIIPDITNPFYPELARGVQDRLSASGYHTFICNSDGERRDELAFLADVVDRHVDGIILSARAIRAADLKPVIDQKIPLVLLASRPGAIGRGGDDLGVDVVQSDDVEGVATATRHLLTAGHTRIAFVGGPADSDTGQARRRGFDTAMANSQVQLPKRFLLTTDFTRAGGVEAGNRLLESNSRPTAIVCANDLIAIGVMDVAQRLGLSIPDDVAVVGFDDIDAASLVSPPLTTVSNPARELGHACARFLLDRMSGDYNSVARQLIVANQLVLRGSA